MVSALETIISLTAFNCCFQIQLALLHVGEQPAGVAMSAGVMEGHDVPPDVLIGVLHWLGKGGYNLAITLSGIRRDALEGSNYCHNEGCEVVGPLKDFKVCPTCKTARYCGEACQKQDWNAGGHKEACGTFHYNGA
jgi:hypothetical protein